MPKEVRNRSRGRSSDQRGATLILALVFIVVVGLIVAAIADLALNDLGNTTRFHNASSLDYAASSVANLAVQSIRYTPQAQNGTLGECWTSPHDWGVSEYQFNSYTVAAWCKTALHPGGSQSRITTIYECESALSSGSSQVQIQIAEQKCVSEPLLTVVEAYDDYSSLGVDACTKNPSASNCSFGATTLAWVWGSLATTPADWSSMRSPSIPTRQSPHTLGDSIRRWLRPHRVIR